jgi:hypothetical protein
MSVPAVLRKSVFRLIGPVRSAVAPGVLLLAMLCTPQANAGVVYTYTGMDFFYSGGPFTTSDSISGSFTVPTALSDDLSNVSITPESFTFSDGVYTVTDVTAHDAFFSLTTNGVGQITDWSVDINEIAGPLIQTLGPVSDLTDCCSDLAENASKTIDDMNPQGYNGYWTSADPTPEPAPFALMVTGLLALALVGRKRMA